MTTRNPKNNPKGTALRISGALTPLAAVLCRVPSPSPNPHRSCSEFYPWLAQAEMVAQSVSRQPKHTEGGLLFVNSSHPDDVKRKGTQRSLRSHSMRCAFRGQPSRKKRPQAITYALERVYVTADTGIVQDDALGQIPIPKSLGLWPFPGDLQPRAQELIYFSAYFVISTFLIFN